MARYFKFKSLDDLRAENNHLGLDLRFSEDLSPLFESIHIGPYRVGNRLCIQPMEGCDGTLDGKPDELTFRRYRRFGAGGAKLIWGEATAVVPEGQANSRQLVINEQNAPDLERMLRECRQAHREAFGSDDDLVVGLQLTHSGRYSYRRPLLAFHDPILDPQTVSEKASGRVVDEAYPLLSDDYLKRLEDNYVAAASLAFRIGFHFVDIKQCHRYLLSELLAAKTRPGRYGGSLENRTRLARDIITRIKHEIPGAVVCTRMNVFDCIPFRVPLLANEQWHSGDAHALQRVGVEGEPCPWRPPVLSAWGTSEADPLQPDLAEPKQWIAEMKRLGVALVNVSMGSPYATPHVIRPFEYPPPDGYETPEHPLIGVDRHFRLAGELQQMFPDLPMVGSGYSYLQEFLPQAGAANISDGRIAIVGVGRAALPQPDFARQLLEHGRLERKRVCRTFSYCTALMRSKHNELGQFATGCPPFDKEVYGPIWDEAKETSAAELQTSGADAPSLGNRPDLVDELRTRWATLLQGLGGKPPTIVECFAELAQRYSAPGRHYHTLRHIGEVLSVIDELASDATDIAAIQLAAWFHDVIYDSRAGDNEERSARFAEEWIERLGIDPGLAPRVTAMIEKTRTHENPEGNRDSQILLDADLSILGSPPEQYDAYATAIRQEYAWVPDADYRAGRRKVLETFLNRNRIYGTAAAYQARESLARANLLRELQRLA